MTRPLATLSLDETVQNAGTLSSDDLKSQILSTINSDTEEESKEELDNESNETLEEEENKTQDLSEENEDVEDIEDVEDEEIINTKEKTTETEASKTIQLLKDQNAFLMEMLKNSKTNKEPIIEKNKAKELTIEEKLEKLADDPDAYIQNAIKPYRDKIEELTKNEVRKNARKYNSDFARLEPVVNKLIEQLPDLATGLSPEKSLEAYYLFAKGLETQQKEIKENKKKSKEKAARLEKKKAAGSTPVVKSVKKDKVESKPIAKQSSAELKTLINSLL